MEARLREVERLAADRLEKLIADRKISLARRDRIERLRGMLKTCAGWMMDAESAASAEWIKRSEQCLEVAGDMEPK